MSFRRYPSYIPSGNEWIGELPAHWGTKPLKHVADFINGDAFKPSDWAESGTPIIRIQNLNGGDDFNYFQGRVEERYVVKHGDLLFGWSGNRGTSFGPFRWMREGTFVLNQHIFRVVSREYDQQALYWLLRAVTAHVEQQAHGIIGMVHITKGDLGAINIPIAPPVERKAITAFLDRETAKIDALVAEQERLIELLKEKRQAVISHAVTKGLNPDVPMRDSGIEWLGLVPAHWRIGKLKHSAHYSSGGTPSKERLDYWNGSVPWASSKDLKVEALSDTQDHITERAVDDGAQLVAPGDILVVVRGMILAHTFPVAKVLVPMAINQDLKAIRPRTGWSNDYFSAVLRASGPETLRRLDEAGHGTKALRMDVWLGMEIPHPPHVEQVAIASFIEREVARTDALTAKASRAISLLEERRSALISAAVTGQIDVRPDAMRTAA